MMGCVVSVELLRVETKQRTALLSRKGRYNYTPIMVHIIYSAIYCMQTIDMCLHPIIRLLGQNHIQVKMDSGNRWIQR